MVGAIGDISNIRLFANPSSSSFSSAGQGLISPLINSFLKTEERIANVPLWSRLLLEWFGEALPTALTNSVLLGQGKSSFWEPIINVSLFTVLGILLPLGILKNLFVAPHAPYTKWLKSKHEFTHNQPLLTPFKYLDETKLNSESNKAELSSFLGIKDQTKIPEIAKSIRTGKLLAMTADMSILAAVSATIFFVRNWIIEAISGKTGAPIEFNYEDDKKREKEAKAYKDKEKWRHIWGAIVGFAGNLTAPLLSWLILTSKSSAVWVGKAKQILPKIIEPTEGIFLNRWLLAFFHYPFNYNAKRIFFFARSSIDMMTNLVASVFTDFFTFFADDWISGVSARGYEKKHKDELGNIKLTHKGIFGLTFSKPFSEIQKEVKEVKDPQVAKLVEGCARSNLRIGLIATAAILGIGMNALNAFIVKWKLKTEGNEKKDDEKKKSQPLNSINSLLKPQTQSKH